MIIEQLVDQDMQKLRNDSVIAYKTLRDEVCKCDKCCKKLDFDFETWHPEERENYNDAFKIVSLLEHFGYPSYDWDTVLYTFYLRSEDLLVKMDGTHLPQAICNVLVEYYKIRSVMWVNR
jgi:hypothetical protein